MNPTWAGIQAFSHVSTSTICATVGTLGDPSFPPPLLPPSSSSCWPLPFLQPLLGCEPRIGNHHLLPSLYNCKTGSIYSLDCNSSFPIKDIREINFSLIFLSCIPSFPCWYYIFGINFCKLKTKVLNCCLVWLAFVPSCLCMLKLRCNTSTGTNWTPQFQGIVHLHKADHWYLCHVATMIRNVRGEPLEEELVSIARHRSNDVQGIQTKVKCER